MSLQDGKNEAALVCQARLGDKEAVRELLERNWSWLKGLLYNMLGNTHDVDDVLQNVCLLVIEKISTLREPERFRPWLATVARRAALSWRQRQRKNMVPLDERLVDEQRETQQSNLLEKTIKNEQNRQIFEAIKLLPEKYREVFLLKYAKDTTYSEIADILEIPVTTVQIRLVRARRMIYNRLTGKPADKIPRT